MLRPSWVHLSPLGSIDPSFDEGIYLPPGFDEVVFISSPFSLNNLKLNKPLLQKMIPANERQSKSKLNPKMDYTRNINFILTENKNH